MLCASVLASYGNGIKIQVRWSRRASVGWSFSLNARVYAKNIATINIYPPRIQDKHTEELENLCRASTTNMAGINLMFSFAGWWKQKYINIVCSCASCIELWESINAPRQLHAYCNRVTIVSMILFAFDTSNLSNNNRQWIISAIFSRLLNL